MASMLTRRRLLMSASAICGAGGALAPDLASAWTVETLPARSPVVRAYAGRCNPSADHAGIAAGLRAALLQHPDLPAASETCPICGCPVTVTRNDL